MILYNHAKSIVMGKTDRFYYLLLVIVSAFFTADLFISRFLPATMDGLIHIATIAQFSDVLMQGDFPVIWLNNFANYGLPVGLFSHQLPIYLGAIITIITRDPVFSTNIVTLIGITGANILFYKFLRIYFPETPTFLATIVFSLAPYRILNVYIRGAIPETFSLLFLPLILILLHRVFVLKKLNSLFLLIVAFIGLTLTHPMMVLIYSFFIVPYFIFLIWDRAKVLEKKLWLRAYVPPVLILLSSGLVALGVASYYIVPLVIEKKYFYFGQYSTLFNNSFLGFSNFIDLRWHYLLGSDIFTRAHTLQVGIIESFVLLIGIIFFIREIFVKKKMSDFPFLAFCIISGIIIIFFLLPISSVVYRAVPILQNIQFPWRMLSVFLIIPPMLLAIFMQRYKNPLLFYGIVLLVVIIRVPELYGKNYVYYQNSFYHSNKDNLHSVNMNTIWSEKTEDYSLKVRQSDIVEGKGTLIEKSISNSSRTYSVAAQTPLKMVDYTFYFPGWNVFIDNKPTSIQFQDPALRGVITYIVPVGNHEVKIVFQDTIVRKIGKGLSIVSFGLLVLFFLLRKTVLSKVDKYV